MKKTIWANVFLLIVWIIFANTLAIERVIWGVLVVSLLQILYIKKLRGRSYEIDISLKKTLCWMRYITLLIKEIWIANIQVAILVLKPKIQLDSGYFRYKTKLKTDFGKMVFANSITLTPGTITVDIEGDELIIHYLTSKIIEGFEDSKMERIILDMEDGR